MKLSNARKTPAYSVHPEVDHPIQVGYFVLADGWDMDGQHRTYGYRVAGTREVKVLDEHTADCLIERIELDGEDENAYWYNVEELVRTEPTPACCLAAKSSRDWNEGPGGVLLCPKCGRKIAAYRP